MRFALEPEEVEAAATLRKILAAIDRDDAAETVRRLEEFGAFDPTLIAVTYEEVGYAGVAIPPRLDGEAATLAAAARADRSRAAHARHDGRARDAREQFGVPVGSFQAVKHHLADALEGARVRTLRPVWRAAVTRTPRDISMAKAMASDAASYVGRQALQCHGAIGYTVEYDLHRFLKQTWVLARTHGDAAWHRQRIAKELIHGS